MIPAYDFSPVGEGVTFLPKGNREGSCARSRLHDSTDLECRGACLLRRSRANPSAVAGPGLKEARRSRTATSPNPGPVSLGPESHAPCSGSLLGTLAESGEGWQWVQGFLLSVW